MTRSMYWESAVADAEQVSGVPLNAIERTWWAGLDEQSRAVVAGLLLRAQAVLAETDREALAELRALAYVDALTGLPNRAALQATAARLLGPAAAGQPSGRVGGLLVDLDGFKAVNDCYGHVAGDELLVAAARRLAEVAEEAGAVVARLGGDEFAVLLAGLPADAAAAGRWALGVGERTVAALAEPYLLDLPGGQRLTVRVGGSVGAATVPAGGALSSLLAAADLAMYAAKGSGGGVRLVPDAGAAPAGSIPAPRRPAVRLRDRPVGAAAGVDAGTEIRPPAWAGHTAGAAPWPSTREVLG